MKIIGFSIFVLRRRICSRHKCRFYAECGQLLRESLNVETVTGKGRSLADMMETRRLVCCVCKRLDGRGTKQNSWGGCKLL